MNREGWYKSCHRMDRSKRTDRWSARKWCMPFRIDRAIIVPERHMSNYYKRHAFKKQPAYWLNCILLEAGPGDRYHMEIVDLRINRYWIQFTGQPRFRRWY